ncbi:MAG: hypothetical protein WC867_03605 [Candidatus Pacearchaeota archaeon]|jgi:uncharacterized protein (UPF0332 family)
MLDEKELNKIKYTTEQLIREEKIIREKNEKYIEFFINNSRNSFDTAKLLYEVSVNSDLNNNVGYPGFNGYLWVINASYYSMFYISRALLEKEGIKIKTEIGIHSIVFNALVYYFYLTGKIEKNILEEFTVAKNEASDLLGKEKAKELIEDYQNEKEKRSRFTYEMGLIAMENKAKTSLDRARKFNEEIRKMLIK